MDLDISRKANTEKFLSGKGIEIGAGVRPNPLPEGAQSLFFDMRSEEELKSYFASADVPYDVHPLSHVKTHFPNGADYLIAHHVLEHTPDPIGVLRQWHSYLHDDGVTVLTLPFYKVCPDDKRLVPPLEHLLFDHLLERDGDDFESREHVLSFLCSWVDVSPGLAGLSAADTCFEIIANTHRSGHDFHWHAFDHELARALICVTCLLDGYVPEFMVADTETPDANGQVSLDIMHIYKRIPMDTLSTIEKPAYVQKAASQITQTREKLLQAAENIPPYLHTEI